MNEPVLSSFGELLRQHRLEAGLTQQLLAERASLSVHGIQKLERGATRPYPDTVKRLSQALQLGTSELARFQTAAQPRLRRPATRPGAATASDSGRPHHHLPNPGTPFVGRQTELGDIAELLARPVSRLVTLVGPGGIGKTRLAIEAGRQHIGRFPDGVRFVPLAPVESPRLLPSVIAEALSLSLSGSDKASTQIVRYLRDKQLLLVLDNFEHLLEGTDLLTDLLDAPNVNLLVTSRERLNLQEEWVLDVAGLAFPSGHATDAPEGYAAVELFVQRAQQVQAAFSLADGSNAEAVIDICRRVEGMPLGLELAATWLRVMPCHEIAPQIERSLDFLTTTVRNVPERHRSLRAVLDHSWNLLSDAERQVLARLSVFRGGFDLEAADNVTGASLRVLASLADKSLIRVSASGRYELHERLRQYLLDKLADSGQLEALKDRHLEFFSRLAENAEAQLYGAQQESWFDRLELEHDNLRAALACSVRNGRLEAGMRLAGALGFFWELRSHWYEAYESLTRLVDHGADAAPLVRAKALRFAAVFAEYTGDLSRATAYCEQSLELARASNDTSSIAWALSTRALYLESRVNPDRAVALFDEALTLFREIRDMWGISHTLRRLGIILTLQGEYARARPLIEEALSGARVAGDKNALAWALFLSGNLVWLQDGDVTRATALFEEALSFSPQIQDWSNHIWLLFTLGAAQRAQGNYGEAQRRYEQMVELIRERQISIYLNWPELLAGALVGLAGLAVLRAKPARAARMFGAASHIPDPSPPVFFRVERERDLAAARDQLGEAAFEAAFQEGRAMSTNQAIDLALQGERRRQGAAKPRRARVPPKR